MKKRLKIFLIIIFSIISLIIIGGYILLKIFVGAFGTDCEKTNSWIVKQYRIQEIKCLGWAGGPYYQYTLFTNTKEIVSNGNKIDSCCISFMPTNDLYLRLNVCNYEIIELRPQKEKINFKNVDSIIVISTIDSLKSKKLINKYEEDFINDWNSSIVWYYREKNQESALQPYYDYTIIVYHNGTMTKFKTLNSLIEDNSNWIYKISKNVDKEYFNRLWK